MAGLVIDPWTLGVRRLVLRQVNLFCFLFFIRDRVLLGLIMGLYLSLRQCLFRSLVLTALVRLDFAHAPLETKQILDHLIVQGDWYRLVL